MKNCWIYLLLLIAILLFSCSKPEGEEYIPLMDGSKSEYSIDYTAPSIGVQKGKMVLRIDGNENINGQRYQKCAVIYSGIPGVPAAVYYYRKAEEGIYVIQEGHKDKPEYLDTAFPLRVGTKWTSNTPDGEIHCRVESLETLELIERPYKDCLKISYYGSYPSGSFEGYFFLAKDIGMVKQVWKSKGITLDYTLEKYSK